LRLPVVAIVAALAVAAAGCGGSAGSQESARARAHTHAGAGGSGQTANGPAKTTTPPTAAARPVHVTPSHRRVPILMYHVIGTPPPRAAYAGLWVSGPELRAQVDALAHDGFTAVTLDRVLDAWHGRATLPPHPIVLSFDDGYLGQGKLAEPILARRHWPGVINVVLENLGVPGGISATRLRQMVAAGWEVDAHTLTHRDLTTLGPADLRHELVGSRARLRRLLGVPVDAFCYPAGRFNATVEQAVRAAGYRAATTELPGAAGPADDPYALPRVRVSGGESAAAVVGSVRAALGSAG
jgi:peptidoglycan/xylan/chitin deacetylase (PgdA/CDA1 family)